MVRIAKLSKRMPVNVVLIALSILAGRVVKAECGATAHNGNALSPQLRSLQEPAVQDEEDFSDQAGSPEARADEKHDSNVSVLGLWKKVYYAGGTLNDIGFAQFNAGGTELLNDVGAFNAGTTFA